MANPWIDGALRDRGGPIHLPYCGVGCGIRLTPGGTGGVAVQGDTAHPANFWRLCSKGSALGETVGLDQRLLAPRVLGVETIWDMALDTVAERFKSTVANHGPDSVAFYVSGQLLTEDYYVANKLTKGFIGSARPISTRIQDCAWPPPLLGTNAPLARIRCLGLTRIWKGRS